MSSQLVQTLLCALLLVSSGACDSDDAGEPHLDRELPAEPAQPEPEPEPSEGNPLAGLERSPEGASSLRGRVEERLEAGSYTYMRISNDLDETRWLVTMGPGVEQGSLVIATSVGLKRDFHSRRLDRDFDELHFVTLEKITTTPEP